MTAAPSITDVTKIRVIQRLTRAGAHSFTTLSLPTTPTTRPPCLFAPPPSHRDVVTPPPPPFPPWCSPDSREDGEADSPLTEPRVHGRYTVMRQPFQAWKICFLPDEIKRCPQQVIQWIPTDTSPAGYGAASCHVWHRSSGQWFIVS